PLKGQITTDIGETDYVGVIERHAAGTAARTNQAKVGHAIDGVTACSGRNHIKMVYLLIRVVWEDHKRVEISRPKAGAKVRDLHKCDVDSIANMHRSQVVDAEGAALAGAAGRLCALYWSQEGTQPDQG